MKLDKYKILIPKTETQSEKEMIFNTATDAVEFLGLKSYSVLYNLSRGKTQCKHLSNQHLKGIKIERINADITSKNKKLKLSDKVEIEKNKTKFLESLHLIVNNNNFIDL